MKPKPHPGFALLFMMHFDAWWSYGVIQFILENEDSRNAMDPQFCTIGL